MFHWQFSAGSTDLGVLSMNILYLLLGLYVWEYFQLFGIEYAVIRGRLSFRWPLVPYLVGRTCLLFFLILLAVESSPYSGDALCQPILTAISVLADISLACSSTNLMIRTWLIWKTSRLMHILLSLLSLAQWLMVMMSVLTLKSTNVNGNCEVQYYFSWLGAVNLTYTTCFDFLVLVLLVVGLSRQRSQSPLKKRLLAQGVVYVAISVIVYIPSTVALLLKNPSLIVIFCNSAIAISSISACRAVRSLLYLDTSESNETPESNVALTTQIVLQSSTISQSEHTITDGQPYIDAADKC